MKDTTGSAQFERDSRPKALLYRDQLEAVEQMIVDALPNIVASRYLVDRIFVRAAAPPNATNSQRVRGINSESRSRSIRRATAEYAIEHAGASAPSLEKPGDKSNPSGTRPPAVKRQ
jgi:hypothetical protein